MMRGGRGFGAGGTNGNGPQRFGDMAGRGVIGEVTSKDDKSLTVKLPDGSSKIVLFSESTTFETTTKAQKSDLKTGQQVRVFGSTNSDGSLTANSIMLNPPMMIQATGTLNPSATPAAKK